MREQVIFCDCCEKPIPKVRKKDVFGIERDFYKLGKINYGCSAFNNIDCRTLGLDICESCADKISLAVQQARIKMLTDYYFKR